MMKKFIFLSGLILSGFAWGTEQLKKDIINNQNNSDDLNIADKETYENVKKMYLLKRLNAFESDIKGVQDSNTDRTGKGSKDSMTMSEMGENSKESILGLIKIAKDQYKLSEIEKKTDEEKTKLHSLEGKIKPTDLNLLKYNIEIIDEKVKSFKKNPHLDITPEINDTKAVVCLGSLNCRQTSTEASLPEITPENYSQTPMEVPQSEIKQKVQSGYSNTQKIVGGSAVAVAIAIAIERWYEGFPWLSKQMVLRKLQNIKLKPEDISPAEFELLVIATKASLSATKHQRDAYFKKQIKGLDFGGKPISDAVWQAAADLYFWSKPKNGIAQIQKLFKQARR